MHQNVMQGTRRFITQITLCLNIAFFACSPPETNSQRAATSSNSKTHTPTESTNDNNHAPPETPAVKLMEMESLLTKT